MEVSARSSRGDAVSRVVVSANSASGGREGLESADRCGGTPTTVLGVESEAAVVGAAGNVNGNAVGCVGCGHATECTRACTCVSVLIEGP